MIAEVLNQILFQDPKVSYQALSVVRALTALAMVVSVVQILRSTIEVIPRPITLISAFRWAVNHGRERIYLVLSTSLGASLLTLQVLSGGLGGTSTAALQHLTLYSLLTNTAVGTMALCAARIASRAASFSQHVQEPL